MVDAVRGDGPAAIIVVRSWSERNESRRFHLTFTPDADPARRRDAYATSVDAVLEHVRSWLEAPDAAADA